MEYFVADSYTGWELIGTPYEKNNKLYTKAKTKCDRCYNGVYITRVENGVPVPHPNYGGVCLKCNGAGYLDKEIRLYTEKEKDAAARSKMRAAERKEAERLASAERKKEEWLKREGFGLNGTTTIYIGSDSYEKKDELKADGWKYSAIGWHVDPEIAADKYPLDSVVTLPWEDLVEFNIYGEGFWLSTAQNLVNQIRESKRPESRSQWIGEEKERIIDIPVTLVSIHGYTNQFGYSQAVKFETEDKSEIMWFTTANIKIKVGEKGILTGTVKKHDIYKNNKITIVTRCKIS